MFVVVVSTYSESFGRETTFWIKRGYGNRWVIRYYIGRTWRFKRKNPIKNTPL